MSSLHKLTLAQAADGLAKKEFSSLELTDACIDRIEETEPALHCLLTTSFESARASAVAADAARKAGQVLSPLHGVPCTIKDVLLTEGIASSAGSKMLKDYVPLFDATTVARLKKAGVVILGKNNMDAWAHGSSTENSDFGPTKNPWDTLRVPGGSSGGSAASVAADQCMFSLGSDTGGSIRQPAALCGVVGFKPTYGRVSRYGSVAMGSSLDTIGPLAKTVEDAAMVMQVIAGKDPRDATTLPLAVPDYSAALAQAKPFSVAVPRQIYNLLPQEMRVEFDSSLDRLRGLGATITDVDMRYLEYGIATYYIIMPSEVSSNLGRYDGIRYGFRDASAQTIAEVYTKSRSNGFGDEAKRRIMIGTYVLSAGYYDAYYKKAMRVRTLIKQEFEELLAKHTVITMPTTLGPAFQFGEKTSDPLQMYLEDIFTVTVNIAGVPAITVPSGTINDLPVGLQLIGKQFDEATLFSVAAQFEAATHFVKKTVV